MNVTKMTYQEWLDKAEAMFGKSPRDWTFICPVCEQTQSGQDFVDAGLEPKEAANYLGFSCIGRFNPDKGCDYAGGGLFRLNPVHVTGPDGKVHQYMAFADMATVLMNTMDAKVWTEKWLATIQDHPDVPTDDGAMLAWFSTALMTGHDIGARKADKKAEGRHAVLLRAAYDLLTRAERGVFVEEAVAIQTHYDGADCDGYCLRDDIACELGISDDTDPIPLEDSEDEE